MVERYQLLTDSQWQVMEPLLPTQRKRRYSLRQMLDAMLYICRTGCQWRNLPTCLPSWLAVYYYFARWRAAGTLERLSHASNQADRLEQGRLPTPLGGGAGGCAECQIGPAPGPAAGPRCP
ncbi:MAG: transposase [Hymenobacter sp.]|nr:MAG: transposase [Hymenobacter sp.]